MKKTIYAMLAGAALMVLGQSCDESGFQPEDEGMGSVRTAGLTVELKGSEDVTRAEGTPGVEEFTVEFVKGTSVAATYTYGTMPEVVALKPGTYTVTAHYGESKGAAFDAPYYLGTSEEFTVEVNKVTDIKSPVVCKLANVKVTINFDESLKSKMSDDSKVTVKVGNSELDFMKSETRSGYFEYVANSASLAATFAGTVDGDAVNETKTYTNVEAGNHYNITFRLHSADTSDPGNITIGGDQSGPIKVDASVNISDLTTGETGNLTPDDDILEDDRRPTEEPKEPDTPDQPVDPIVPEGPSVTACEGVTLSDGDETGTLIPLTISNLSQCTLYVKSETGLTEFKVKIVSEQLSGDELTNMNLAEEFDLCAIDITSPMATTLGNLGFLPMNEDRTDVLYNYMGNTDKLTLDITSFLTMLGLWPNADHSFVITVTDAGGTTTKTLTLHND